LKFQIHKGELVRLLKRISSIIGPSIQGQILLHVDNGVLKVKAVNDKRDILTVTSLELAGSGFTNGKSAVSAVIFALAPKFPKTLITVESNESGIGFRHGTGFITLYPVQFDKQLAQDTAGTFDLDLAKLNSIDDDEFSLNVQGDFATPVHLVEGLPKWSKKHLLKILKVIESPKISGNASLLKIEGVDTTCFLTPLRELEKVPKKQDKPGVNAPQPSYEQLRAESRLKCWQAYLRQIERENVILRSMGFTIMNKP